MIMKLTTEADRREADSLHLRSGIQRNRSECSIRSGFLIVISIFLIILSSVHFGCSSTGSRNRIFDPSGRCLFSSTSGSGAKTVPSNKEGEIVQNTTSSTGTLESPWKSGSQEITSPLPNATKPIPESSINFNAQRPNGSVLFPSKLEKTGPLILLEPKNTVVPVGTELVLVASYVGPENKYLRTREKLEWGIEGSGRFLTSNPQGCLDSCDLANTKKLTDKAIETTTTDQLWRIHRGTTTPEDDITILRGQSWATILSNQEGTSVVSVLAPGIDNWENRTATTTIRWLDALFLFPQSGIAPSGQPQTLTTSVLKKSDPAAVRKGWIVRYEVVSGPAAGFGPQLAPIIEVATDQNGQANAVLTQKDIGSGTNQIMIKISKPGINGEESCIAAEKQITQTWTSSSFFDIKLEGPRSVRPSSPAHYRIRISNLTGSPQDAVVRMPIPKGTTMNNSTPAAFVEKGIAVWNLENIPSRSTQLISFTLTSQREGAIDIFPRVDRRTNIGTKITTPPVQTIPYQPSTLPSGTGSPVSPLPTAQSPPPVLSGNQANTTNKSFYFNIDSPFPKTARQNEPFNIIFSLKNTTPSKVSEIIFETIFPPGVAIVSDGQRYGSSPLDFGKHSASAVINKTFPLTYVSTTTGLKSIIIRAKTPGGEILAVHTGTITITQGQTNTEKSPPNLTITIKPSIQNAPNFAQGSQVPFLIQVQNNENYSISNLKVICTPEQNRQLSPWKLTQSQPTKATALSTTGSWMIPLGTLNARSAQTVSFTFLAEKSVANGIFDVSVRSDSTEKPIASKQYVYSIATMKAK